MATSRAIDLAKMLGIQPAYYNGYNTNNSSSSPSSLLYSFGIIILFIFIILIVIHKTITPIFSFEAPSKFLPFFNTTDGQLTWTSGPVASDLSANIIRILPCSITIQQDIYIENETIINNRRRVFSYRSMKSVVPNSISDSSKEDLITQYPDTNLLMYLSSNTNDIIVSAITQNGTQQYIESAPTVLNVPIRQPFRLTTVFSQKSMEIYINGRLHGTKIFRYTPKQTSTNFYGPPDAFRTSVRTMNFMYWDRALSANEIINNNRPNLALIDSFHPSKISGQCSS